MQWDIHVSYPFLLVGSIDRTVRIWNTETPKKNKTVIKTKNKQGRSYFCPMLGGVFT